MNISERDYNTSQIARRLRMLILQIQVFEPEPRTQVNLLLHWTAEWYLNGMKAGFIAGLIFGGLLTLVLARL